LLGEQQRRYLDKESRSSWNNSTISADSAGGAGEDEGEDEGEGEQSLSGEGDAVMRRLVTQSGKLSALLPLLKRLRRTGHRTLVFSQSKMMLSLISTVLEQSGLAHLQIDGSTKLPDRQKAIDTFTNDKRYACMLLTTGEWAPSVSIGPDPYKY
jgi:SNF2 family DNA or RNA helicase